MHKITLKRNNVHACVGRPIAQNPFTLSSDDKSMLRKKITDNFVSQNKIFHFSCDLELVFHLKEYWFNDFCTNNFDIKFLKNHSCSL